MEWAARAIGVFYVLGGLMLLYQAWLNWRLQQALSHLVSTGALVREGKARGTTYKAAEAAPAGAVDPA